jgi:hypothetical protein
MTTTLAGRDGTSENAPGLAQVSTNLITQSNPPRQPAWSPAQPLVASPTGSEHSIVNQETDRDDSRGLKHAKARPGLILHDALLDELASELALIRGGEAAGTPGVPGLRVTEVADSPAEDGGPGLHDPWIIPVLNDLGSRPDPSPQSTGSPPQWGDLVLGAGFCDYAAGTLTAWKRRSRSLSFKKGWRELRP